MTVTATTLMYANGARIRITMAADIYKYLQITFAPSNLLYYHLATSNSFRDIRIIYVILCEVAQI